MFRTNETAQPRQSCAPDEAAAEQQRLIVFHVADQSYALHVDEVREILPLAELAHPPACPALLAGLVNLGGVPVPVVSLSHLFGLSESPCGLYTPLLILSSPLQPLALLVDRVSKIVSATSASIAPVGTNHSLNDCVTGVLRLDDASVLVLSSARLLVEHERAYLAELRELEQARCQSLETPGP